MGSDTPNGTANETEGTASGTESGTTDQSTNLDDMPGPVEKSKWKTRKTTLAKLADSVLEDGATHRWYHIPINDTGYAEACVKIIQKKTEDSRQTSEQKLRQTCEQKLRPTISEREQNTKPNAWYLEPSFQITPKYGTYNWLDFQLFLPYLNWETYGYIRKREPEDFDGTHHIRKTLDQFYYPSLENTQKRDATQTITKMTGKISRGSQGGQRTSQWSPLKQKDEENEKPPDNSRLIMVDQLWIWAIDEYTIVSCYPIRDLAKIPAAWSSATTEVMLVPTTAKETNFFEACEDTIDLVATIAAHSVKSIFEEKKNEFTDMLSLYRLAVTTKAARHTRLLEDFMFSEQQSEKKAESPSDGEEELKLATEVIDILDELNILLHLFETQTDVLKLFQQKLAELRPPKPDSNPSSATTFNITRCNIETLRFESNSFHQKYNRPSLEGYAGRVIDEAIDRIRLEASNVERLCSDANRTHKMVLELLDLEQKMASLQEARETTKQGRAVMLFTVITIIFLPLSFFTSYFGQNVVEFTGDENNPTSSEVWKIGGPISAVVIVVALVIAYMIMHQGKTSKKVTRNVEVLA